MPDSKYTAVKSQTYKKACRTNPPLYQDATDSEYTHIDKENQKATAQINDFYCDYIAFHVCGVP
jgi:hypothetical protein